MNRLVSLNRFVVSTAMAWLFIAFLAVVDRGAAAPIQWTGGSSLNWSDPGNWSAGVPGSADTIYFEDLLYANAPTNAPGLVNVVLDSSTVIGAAIYDAYAVTNSFAPFLPNHFYTTFIPASSGLGIAGLDGMPALTVGWNVANYPAGTVVATILGSGSLAITNAQSTVTISEGSSASGTHKATLDLSGLGSFTANVSNFLVGVSSTFDKASGAVLLATNTTITTAANTAAPGILLGRGMTNTGFGSITMGAGSTTAFNTDGLVVGGARASFGANLLNFQFVLPGMVPAATFTLRGSAGGNTPTSVFSIGDSSANETNYQSIANGTGTGGSSSAPSTADFTFGNVDVLVTNLYIGRSAADNAALASGSSAGTAFGSLIFNNGTIDAQNAFVGLKQGTNKSVAVGTLTARANATLIVSNDLTLALVTNGVAGVTATVNVNDNAVLTIGGNMLTKGGTSTLNLAGGTVNMTNGGNVSLNALTGFGSIINSANIVVSNSLIMGLSNATTVLPATINAAGNVTLLTNVSPKFKLGSSTTTGGGVNDYFNVGGNLILANNNLDVGFVAGGPAVGTYDFVDYAGSLTGVFRFNFTNTTRNYTFTLDQSVPNHIRMTVAGGPPPTLTWKGGASGTWDLTNNVSWNNNTEKFYTLDNVLFDDTASQPIISITSGVTVTPGNITFNNGSTTYTLYAPGKISGPAGVTKNGGGTVIWDTQAANDFTGPININRGVIQVQSASGSANFFGVTNKLITIANGATLDVYGNTVGSSSGTGWPITFSGTGFGGIGAIAHTKPSSGPTLYTPRATLAADATIGISTTNLNLIISAPSTAFSGLLDLGGFTLTSGGLGNLQLVNLIITNSGNIQVGTPNLVLRDVILDGTGTLTVGSKSLYLGNVSGTAWTTGYVAKPISIGSGSIVALAAGTVTIPVKSPVNLTGALTVSNAQPIRSSGIISGGGGLTKAGSAMLTLAAANTYNGSTVVSDGTLALEATGSFANSPLVQVNAGAVLDVSAQAGSYVVASGQNVQVDGSVNGNITVPAGATLSGSGTCPGVVTVNGGNLVPGKIDMPRTLTVGNLSLSDAFMTFELDAPTTIGGSVNDLLAVSQLNLAGANTIKIVPIGALNTAGTYTLFTYSGATLPSSITNNLILTSDTRYVLSFVDPATTPGSIQVMVAGGQAGLVWQGGTFGAETSWNINTTSNWFNGVSADVFFNGDSVQFDDSANTNLVNLLGRLRPATINLANNSLAYTFTGNGSIRTGAITNGGSAGLTIGIAGSTTLSGGGLFLNSGNVTFNQPSDTTFTGILNGFGGGSLTKQGANLLTVTGDNGSTYYGPVNVSGGTLQSGFTNALGSGSIAVASGATLDINGQVMLAPSVSVAGMGAGGAGAIMNSGGTQTNGLSKVALTGDVTLNSSNRWDVAPGTFSYFQGNGYALTKVGPGDIYIDVGSDTGVGDVDIQQGRLVFGYAGTDLGSVTNSITVRSNASLAFAYDITAGVKPVTVMQGGDLEAFANTASPVVGASNVYAGDVTFSSAGLVRVANLAGLNLAGSVHGPAGIVSADRGNLTLSGSNDYAGGLTVHLGQASIASSTALPAGSFVTMDCTGIPSSDSVFLNLIGDVVTPASVTLNLNSYRTPSGTLNSTLAGEGTWSGPIVMNGIQTDPSQNPTVSFSASTNLTISGPVSQIGAPKLAMNILGFPGTVRFQSPLVYNGTMTMGSQGLGVDPILTQEYTTMELDSSANAFTNMLFWRGKLIIGADNAIPLNCPITTSAIRTDNDARGIIDLHGHVQTFQNFPGLAITLGSAAMPIWFGNDSTTSDSTIIWNSAISNTWVCWIVDNINTNNLTPHKTGLSVVSGVLRLAPWTWGGWFDPSSIVAATNNAYTGPTTVTGGTLQVDIALSNTVTTVSGSGTLSGVGPFNGPVIIGSGGTLSPGGSSTLANSIGRMTNNSTLTLQAGSKCYLEVNLTTKTNDSVFGLSSVAYGGTLVITNVGAQAFTNGTILKLFTATNYVAGPVAIQPVIPAPGLVWDASQLAVDGTLRVVSPVPTSISGAMTLPSGAMSFNISGGIGEAYSVRASTNAALAVTNWTILQSGTLSSTTINFIDLTSTNFPQRFYIISTP